jgi:short-subunit dehydrogenase
MKKAIIIGASSGIGREIALQLANVGFLVGIAARRENLLDELKREIGVERCLSQVIDISDVTRTIDAFRALYDRLGTVDFVYLVAGVGFANPNLEPDIEARTIQINCTGFALIASETIRRFFIQGTGHLIGITSVAAARPSCGAPAYGASKAFDSIYLEGMRYLVISKKLPIHVTEVRPGFVQTDMLKAHNPFWVTSPSVAARAIIRAAKKKRRIAYITPRWRIVWVLLRMLPESLYLRMTSK